MNLEKAKAPVHHHLDICVELTTRNRKSCAPARIRCDKEVCFCCALHWELGARLPTFTGVRDLVRRPLGGILPLPNLLTYCIHSFRHVDVSKSAVVILAWRLCHSYIRITTLSPSSGIEQGKKRTLQKIACPHNYSRYLSVKAEITNLCLPCAGIVLDNPSIAIHSSHHHNLTLNTPFIVLPRAEVHHHDGTQTIKKKCGLGK